MREEDGVRLGHLALTAILTAIRLTSHAEVAKPIEHVDTQTTLSRNPASIWGLSAIEWQAYQQVMEDRRGVWSPGLDPITALGVSADTAAERDRYAELYVRTEFERTRKELAFQLAVDRAWARLYPETPRIRPRPAALSGGEAALRYALIVTPNCLECEGVIADRLARMLGEAQEGVDIHVVGTGGDDDALRGWIVTQPDLVGALKAGKVTVNHGSQFEDLESFPAIYSKTGQGLWIREL